MNLNSSPDHLDKWEVRLQQAAATFPYPATPDLSRPVLDQLAAGRSSRSPLLAPRSTSIRLAWAAVLILALLGALLAVPTVRAGLIEFLQLGDIRIFFTPATATPTATATLPATQSPISNLQSPTPTRTPRPSPTPTFSVLDLAGETTLAEAEAQAGFTIGRPTYPADLGEPDHVFYQQMDGPVVILVWLQPNSQQEVRLTLYALQLDEGAFGGKFVWEESIPTTVNDQPAYWVTGEHWLRFYDANGREQQQFSRFVPGNVLIWQRGEITYRLETDLPLEESIRIAESLTPLR
jgi:hypothetical protein